MVLNDSPQKRIFEQLVQSTDAFKKSGSAKISMEDILALSSGRNLSELILEIVKTSKLDPEKFNLRLKDQAWIEFEVKKKGPK